MADISRCRRCARIAPWLSFWGNLALALHKLVVGLLGGSSALVADAMHSFADVMGSSSILVATRVSSQSPDTRFPYGRGKAEFVGAVFVYVLLAFFAGGIVWTSSRAILDGTAERPHIVTAVGALVSVLYNYLMYKYATCAGTRNNSPAILADAFENRADALSSVAVIIGIFAALLINPVCDAIGALIVGVIILWNCQEQLRIAARGLMDNGLPPDNVATITSAAMQDGVLDVLFVRTRQTGVRFWMDVGVAVAPDASVDRADKISAAVRSAVMQTPLCHHVEVYVLPSSGGIAPEPSVEMSR